MSKFEEGYERVLKNIGGVQGTNQGDLYTSRVQNAMDIAAKALKNESTRLNNVDALKAKGFIAEQWHAHTLLINAAAKDKSDIYAHVPGGCKPGQDIEYGNFNTHKVAEIKYYNNATDTAKGLSRAKYANSEKVAPSDQIDSIPEAALNRAKRILADPKNPEQLKDVDRLIDTANRAKDQIEVDGVTSKKLSNSDANKLAQELKDTEKIALDKYGISLDEVVNWSDIARQSGQAALTAASLSAAITAAPVLWSILNEYIEKGDVDVNNLSEGGTTILEGSFAAGLRGGVAAALTVTFKAGMMGKHLSKISPAAIGLATTITLNVVGYAIKLKQNKITQTEFANYCMKDTYILSCALGGAALGQFIIPIPMVGALIGNIIGASLGAIAYEGVNGIILGLSVKNGWTFFGLVKQNYSVPMQILQDCGYECIKIKPLNVKTFQPKGIKLKTFAPNSLDIVQLRRGVIASNIVGYI